MGGWNASKTSAINDDSYITFSDFQYPFIQAPGMKESFHHRFSPHSQPFSFGCHCADV
jgi:hypothetical protein